ncbi:MAG TPA: 4Fe-4S dicluster domain-containing protein [Conexivisphaerales archaeon]|nr:4Fe-4S dicluster domain-containing protein [Conexivisphaerales archaeon]
MTEAPWWESNRLSFVYDRILSLPEGRRIFECIQCGTCGGACPVSFAMDRTPRQVINLVRSGRVDEALRSESIWLCASCYNCTVECPAGIKITDVMYTLKVASTEMGIHHKNVLGPVFAKTLVKQLETNGRISEVQLILTVALHKLSLLTTLNPVVYLRLFKAGRVKLRGEKVKGVEQLRKMDGWLIASDFSLEDKDRV